MTEKTTENNTQAKARIHVCGVTCHKGDANCNGYCTDSTVPHAKLIPAVAADDSQPIKRLTPSHIDAAIVNEAFLVFPDSTVTVCMLTLRNGAKVLGHNYGSIDPIQQDWATGRREARAIAVEKVWELEGYLLRQNLAFSLGGPGGENFSRNDYQTIFNAIQAATKTPGGGAIEARVQIRSATF